MAKIKLPYFGIHEDSAGTKHLFQDICPDGFNYEGVRNRSKMTTRKLTEKCPHAVIPTLSLRRLPDKHWNVFQKILKDELVQAMLPIPTNHTQLVYLEIESLQGKLLEVLACLERMCTPMNKSIFSLSETKIEEVITLLGVTNIHPLVLTGATTADSDLIVTLANISMNLPRKLIIAGSRDIALTEEVIRIQSNILSLLDLPGLISLPMEHIGGELIKRYCQKEDFYKPMNNSAEDC